MREAYEEGKVGHRLKISNWIASNFQLPYLPSYTLLKWSNKSMQKILAYTWPYTFLHFSQQYTVHIMAWRGKNRPGFSHVCVCVLSKIKISHSKIIPIYYCGIGSGHRHGGSNRLWAYLAYGGYKRGSNRHRRCDTAMMKSALIICMVYIT